MLYTGRFINQKGALVSVEILTNDSRAVVKEIGTDETGIFFDAEEAVIIESGVNDTFDHLLCQTATIKLQTRKFIADLFSLGSRDTRVNIRIDGHCVFAGFIEPYTYSQPFVEVVDDIELNCVDVLSALQYGRYGCDDRGRVDYNTLVENAGLKSFGDILRVILHQAADGLDISGEQAEARIFYDNSKTMEGRESVFGSLAVSDALMIGEDEEDVWKQNEALEEILRYLNLHIEQRGFDFYIYDWHTVKNGSSAIMIDMEGGTSSLISADTHDITLDIVADTDAQIEVGEVFNSLELTCSREEIDNLIESPLDEDALTSPYASRQQYLDEVSTKAHGHWDDTYKEFRDIAHLRGYADDNNSYTRWYVQIMQHPRWRFPSRLLGDEDVVSHFTSAGEGQQELLNYLASRRVIFSDSATAGSVCYTPGAAIVKFGSVEMLQAEKDNSPTDVVSMEPRLIIPVNGNGVGDDFTQAAPSDSDLLLAVPVAEYRGGVGGAVLSPTDESVTNYIVISGKVALMPVVKLSWPANEALDLPECDLELATHFDFPKYAVKCEEDEERYYTQLFYGVTPPSTRPLIDRTRSRGFSPYSSLAPKSFKFKYSQIGDSTDKISKVPVLACMLTVGRKVLVETFTREGGNSVFTWEDYKPLAECKDVDEYYDQCFTIGFNPKIDDWIVGEEYEITNTVSHLTGIDAKGMAIPMRKSDALSGEIQFKILGPINCTWDEVTRRHRTWFRKTKWSTKAQAILPLLDSIQLSNLEIKVYTDNAHLDTADDNDLVYVSDTDERYTNKKDDLDLKIHSALTADECRELGIADTPCLSTVNNLITGLGNLSIRDNSTGNLAKPEQLYVDAYWREYHKPRITLSLNTEGTNYRRGDIFRHPALPGKTFFVLGIGYDMSQGTTQLTLKEIDDD